MSGAADQLALIKRLEGNLPLFINNSWKFTCRVATTANITLSGNQTVDGIALVDGESCLVWKQTNAYENGIYIVSQGAWTRRNDCIIGTDIVGSTTYIQEGALYKQLVFGCSTVSPITIETTNISYVIAGGATPTLCQVLTAGNDGCTLQIKNIADPTAAQDADTKGARDAAIAVAVAAANPAQEVNIATTVAGDTSALVYNNGASGIGATLTGAINTPITFDGVTLTVIGQRALIKNDTVAPSGSRNGVYYLSQLQTALLPPILIRALNYDQPSDINYTGAIIILNGATQAGQQWNLTTQVTTIGTDPLTYGLFVPAISQIVTLTGAQALSNKTGLISQWTNDSAYIKSGDAAGGDLTGTYVNPTIAANKVTYQKTYNGNQLSIVSAFRFLSGN